MSNSTYFVDGYPYSDTHNLNLDWVINKLKQIETQMGEITDGLEVHVKDDSGTEVYVFTVKSNGVYITRPDGGTPIYYNLATGQLHAPTFDGQSILTATARTTGQLRAGSLVLDTPLPITGGGTGATTAPEALTALGGEPAFDVLGIPKGGTGATSAASARAALGAINKAGDTMTGNLRIASMYWPSYELARPDGTQLATMYSDANDNKFAIRGWNTSGTQYNDFKIPDTRDVQSNETYNILTTRNITNALLSVNSGLAIGDTNAHAVTLTDAPANYLGAVIAVGWQAITDATGFVFVPSIRWAAASAMRVYVNNDPAEQYITISARTANGLTYQASNAGMALAVYGILRIA